MSIYRPDFHNLSTRRKKIERVASGNKVSVNVKTINTFKYDYFPVFQLFLKNA